MPVSTTRLAALMIGTALVPLAALAQELPADPVVVSGAVTLGTPGPGRLEIGQTSTYGILDWGSFGIGEGAAVAFLNGSGATLNRVTGGTASALLGTLSATGSVYLVNPAGVVIGRDGVVDTGGRFVASTLDVAAADFLDGGDLTFAGDGAALVVNFGQVGSSGGDVALIARTVRNAGTITAPQGTVGLISGTQVLMRDAAVEEGLFSVILGADGGEVTEAGTIRAAAAELRAKGGNVYALAGNTDHVIAATGVEKVAGRIFLTAEGGKVEAAKPVSAKASGGSGGTITVTGTVVDLAGTLDASGSLGGRVVVKAVDEADFSGMITTLGGGFVELSGGHITYDGHIDQGGGTLLIDPHNIEVSSDNGTVLTNATILTPGEIFDWLSTGDVILDTTSADTGDAGTIRIFDPLFWSTDSSLTLLATGDVLILASVQTSGAGDITVVAGWDGATGEDSVGGIDTAVLDAEDLATTTAFGQANGIDYVDFSSAAAGDITPGTAGGNVFIGDISAANGTSVGSASGATRVYGSSVVLAAGADGAFAQIGYHPTGGTDYGTISGDIGLRATGSLYMLGGTGYDLRHDRQRRHPDRRRGYRDGRHLGQHLGRDGGRSLPAGRRRRRFRRLGRHHRPRGARLDAGGRPIGRDRPDRRWRAVAGPGRQWRDADRPLHRLRHDLGRGCDGDGGGDGPLRRCRDRIGGGCLHVGRCDPWRRCAPDGDLGRPAADGQHHLRRHRGPVDDLGGRLHRQHPGRGDPG